MPAGSGHAAAAGGRLPGLDGKDAVGAEQPVAGSQGAGTQKWRLVGPGEVWRCCFFFHVSLFVLKIFLKENHDLMCFFDLKTSL